MTKSDITERLDRMEIAGFYSLDSNDMDTVREALIVIKELRAELEEYKKIIKNPKDFRHTPEQISAYFTKTRRAQ